jgi:hypothetical protein
MQPPKHSKTQAIVRDGLIGIPILFTIFAVMVGSFEDALFFLFVAVVCTLGVSLVILLPLAWVVGTITYTVVTTLMRQFRGARSAA